MSSHGGNDDELSPSKLEPIAIIGMACRFPQDATSPADFWEMLRAGRSSMTEVPANRFNINAYTGSNDRLDTTSTRSGHFLSGDIAAFDAPFFSIPKHEADALDPQQRGLLECTYHALENAGLNFSETNATRTGVFVGCMGREYDWTLARDPEAQHQYQAIGSGSAMLSNRLSWFYDWKGPSVTVDTACSSSLVALHLACQSLRSGECSTAVVGGANLIINPDNMIAMSNLNFLSPDGLCYSFDHRANGYSRGEGFGVLVIRTLSNAIKNNNNVRALIRATHCNQDGRTAGITNPSKDAQVALIRDTYDRAGISLAETRFFEAHGTGTQTGDVTEASAIQEVFGDVRSKQSPIIVGAMKSNIGHLEGASGVASIIKTVMVLEKGIIPPNANFEKVNPKIPIHDWSMKIPTEVMPWPSSGLRRASVNSFGYGGANAHAVLDDASFYMMSNGLKYQHSTMSREQKGTELKRKGAFSSDGPQTKQPKGNMTNGGIEHYSPPKQSIGTNKDEVSLNRGSFYGVDVFKTHERPILLNFSASDKMSLEKLCEGIQAHQSSSSKPSAETHASYAKNLAHTLSSKRNALRWRSFSLVQHGDEIPAELNASAAVRSPVTSTAVAFIFTGQGAAWWDMGLELFAEPLYRQSISLSNQYLQAMGCEWDLVEELTRGEERSRILEAHISQPATTALQIALVNLLKSWGIRPSAVVGHSSGEIAAAYCIGALSHQAAMQTAFFRGKVAAELPKEWNGSPEGMLVVALSLEDVEMRLPPYQALGAICIACINSPKHITLSGSLPVLVALQHDCEVEGIFAKLLRVDVAYHSPTMERLSEKYSDYLQGINDDQSKSRLPNPTDSPLMFSSVTGLAVPNSELQEPSYWVANMVSRVRFSEALIAMHQHLETTGLSCFAEIGPTNALRRPILETLGDVVYSPCLGCEISAYRTMLCLAGKLWCYNVPVDLIEVNKTDISMTKMEVKMLIDLPQYPFNHSRTYWHESRINKGIRFRKWPRNPLLGVRDGDNGAETKWKNKLCVSELPWIKDHRVNGSRLFPAAGMVLTAVEAARELVADDVRRISGFRIRDFRISKALVFPDDAETLDLETAFRNKCTYSDSTSWSFRIYFWSHNTWAEACSGIIIVETFDAEQTSSPEQIFNAQAKLQSRNHIQADCIHDVLSKQMYDNLVGLGFNYGPAFRLLADVRWGDDCGAAASLPVAQTSASSSTRGIRSFISPLTLEGLFQVPLVAVSKGSRKAIPTMIPSEVNDLWLSAKLFDLDIDMLELSTRGVATGMREHEFEVIASTLGPAEIVMTFDGYRVTAISDVPSGDWRRICFKESWKMDSATATVQDQISHCEQSAACLADLTEELVDEAELVCLYFMYKALEATVGFIPEQAHLRKYAHWMAQSLQSENFRTLLESHKMSEMLSSDTYAQRVLSSIGRSGTQGQVYTSIGQNLTGIIRGDIDVVELLFGDDLLQRFYTGHSFSANYERMRAYVELLAHKNPNMDVLEIGAGTGGATVSILKTLGRDPGHPHSSPRFHAYQYTDISAGFFQAARERFDISADRMSFRVLDIEKPPKDQGFETNSYDLVIASCVLHATSDLSQVLRHTRSLLKPGGKLLLFEPTNPTCARLPFVFGLLEGWWLAKEKSRALTPLLSAAAWNEVLQQNGFTGSDLCMSDYEGKLHTFSVLVSTATNDSSSGHQTTGNVVILIDPSSELQAAVAVDLKERMSKSNLEACIIQSPGIFGSTELGCKLCVSLVELDRPLLHQINAEQFALLKQATKDLNRLLWVTSDSSQKPLAALTTGFARSISSEVDTLDLTVISLQDLSIAAMAADRIFRVMQVPQDARENEYIERGGRMYINRIIEDNRLNNLLFRHLVTQPPKPVRFGDLENRSLCITSSFPGRSNAIHFIDDDEQMAPGDCEVEIVVQAVGISTHASKIVFGELRGTSFVQECAGFITRISDGVLAEKFSVGDRVCCLSGKGFKTRLICPVDAVQKIPNHLSFAEAASVPIAWSTAYYSLHHLAQLRAGESVLVQNATNPVGLAVIRLLQSRNSRIFAAVSSEQEKEFLVEAHRLHEDYIFFNKSRDIEASVKQMTDGQGVSIVLHIQDFIGRGVSLLGCLAPLGRFIYAKQYNERNSDRQWSPVSLGRSASVFVVDILTVLESAPGLMQHVFAEAMQFFSECCLADSRIPTAKLFPASQLSDAFHYAKENQNLGRAIVHFSANDLVPVVENQSLRWRFGASATYVIAGGTGGLGRSIARWMISKGAHYILLLGRSGCQSKSVQDLIAEAKRKKVMILAPACNVSDGKELRQVIDDCSKILPPVKGCIQASMILRDSLLQNMSHAMFLEVLEPKVQGTINLQMVLPRSMDFFVLLSSTTGIFGSRGQSNYAASSTFQNAFAKHLASKGQRCLALDLGMMLDVGYAAERQHITDSLRAAGYDGISEAEFHALLNWACDPELILKDMEDAHAITGISTPAAIKAKGLDEIYWMRKPIFRGLHQMDRIPSYVGTEDSTTSHTDYRSLVQQTSTTDAAGRVIAQGLVEKLAKALTLPAEDFDLSKPIHTYGVDSLVSVEIRYWCKKNFDAEVAVFDILQSESIAELCRMVASKSGLVAQRHDASNVST